MGHAVKFIYSISRYEIDLSQILEDSEDSQRDSALELIRLIREFDIERSKKKKNEIKKQIFDLLDFSLDIDLDPGKLFSINFLSVPVNNITSDLNFYCDDNTYGFSGDIWFELIAKRSVTTELMEKWEDSGGEIHLPAFDIKLGEYAGDSGSSVDWEILGDSG